jgi:predicted RNase H-like nuclease (RuvC/YqgF family)
LKALSEETEALQAKQNETAHERDTWETEVAQLKYKLHQDTQKVQDAQVAEPQLQLQLQALVNANTHEVGEMEQRISGFMQTLQETELQNMHLTGIEFVHFPPLEIFFPRKLFFRPGNIVLLTPH